jgi:hypothetical protein
VEQDAHALLVSWEAFNVIVGPAAAVLIGLQFVAITLSAEANTAGAGSAIGAFSTPTIVHFCAVLFIAAMLSAPWPALSPAALLLGACAVVGLAYTLRSCGVRGGRLPMCRCLRTGSGMLRFHSSPTHSCWWLRSCSSSIPRRFCS